MPDHKNGLGEGISALLSQSEGAISTWAWGLHRICDIVKERWPDTPVIAFGHSRLGKTSLWAAATNEKIDAVVSNESGTGGAALARRINNERVGGSRWYTARLSRYNRKENQMPFDQHFLLGAIAPRPLYVASAAEDISATPISQYLSLYHAQPAYRLAGIPLSLPTQVPAVTDPLSSGPVGFHVRPGFHDVTLYDWQCFADFFDQQYGH